MTLSDHDTGAATLDPSLIAGVVLTSLIPHNDERGTFTELFRKSWSVADPIQWNAVRSRAGVLRGVHVHPRHDDYLTVYAGRACVGLRDLRRGSPTSGRAEVLELFGESPVAISIPHGVAHGFYFHEDSIHIYAVSHYWDPADELGCHWQDANLEIPWPAAEVELSERDAALPKLSVLEQQLEPHQPI